MFGFQFQVCFPFLGEQIGNYAFHQPLTLIQLRLDVRFTPKRTPSGDIEQTIAVLWHV